MTKQARPDVQKVLGRLKDFQRKSVDYIYRRLYEDQDKTNRFLIADEVGLGKTLVAKGVIARAVDRLWDDVDRIDVIYICSNHDIARQNVDKLSLYYTDQEPVDRITLLPLDHERLNNKLNFVFFTPGTSLNIGDSSGWMKERALLFRILVEGDLVKDCRGGQRLFSGRVKKESWEYCLSTVGYVGTKKYHLNRNMCENFIKRLRQLRGWGERCQNLCESFHSAEAEKDRDLCHDRTTFIGELRMLLAQSCISELEPDIIILDEFQRFKYLLNEDPEDDTAFLAQQLFNYQSKEIERTKILLLSATPYKMFTNYDDQDDHYQDLKQTLNFLFNSSRNSELLDVELKKYVSALQDLGHPESLDQLVQSTQSIEAMLRKVMVRTEKLSNSANRNGMLEKSTCDLGTLTRMELESFKALDNVSDVLETGDAMEYWKSGPYLLNLMDDSYAMKRKINKLADNGGLDERTALALKQATPYMLSHRDLRSYRQVDPANSKLRTLIENSIERGGWKLLWMPPSLPYYQVTEGPYAEPDLQGISKSLLFSSWQLVPKVIATMVSYEAERCMMLSGDPNANDSSHEKAKGLLRFNVSEGRNTGMNIFTLVYPCRTLASEIDPLEIAAELAREKGGQQPSYPELFMAVSRRVERLVSPLLAGRETGGREDESWYWAALALLDSRHFRKEVGEWFLPGMTVGARVKVGDKNGSSTGVIHDITGGMATVKFLPQGFTRTWSGTHGLRTH